jgi:hypothetical protein
VTRARLLKARAASVALVVQRESRSGDAGHERVHVPLRVARPAAEPMVPA